ncbi:MAG: hypothetical protein I8H75_03245 [Myxococcaceae bacterium]|nr:hypothetical protein [Myxococcaceae bacterium]MBH2006346.1 hypothetical protein [Myxococcaceae bacterium]
MKIASLIGLLLLMACNPSTKQEPHIQYLLDSERSELKVLVTLPSGLHAYAPGERIGKSIELEIRAHNGWKLRSKPKLPAGDKNHLLSGQFEILAQITAGQGPLSGVLRMQTCSHSSCGRPHEYPFTLDL